MCACVSGARFSSARCSTPNTTFWIFVSSSSTRGFYYLFGTTTTNENLRPSRMEIYFIYLCERARILVCGLNLFRVSRAIRYVAYVGYNNNKQFYLRNESHCCSLCCWALLRNVYEESGAHKSKQTFTRRG